MEHVFQGLLSKWGPLTSLMQPSTRLHTSLFAMAKWLTWVPLHQCIFFTCPTHHCGPWFWAEDFPPKPQLLQEVKRFTLFLFMVLQSPVYSKIDIWSLVSHAFKACHCDSGNGAVVIAPISFTNFTHHYSCERGGPLLMVFWPSKQVTAVLGPGGSTSNLQKKSNLDSSQEKTKTGTRGSEEKTLWLIEAQIMEGFGRVYMCKLPFGWGKKRGAKDIGN